MKKFFLYLAAGLCPLLSFSQEFPSQTEATIEEQHFLSPGNDTEALSPSFLLLRNRNYLALGDSLPFGFNPLINPPSLNKYVGYPQLVSLAMLGKLTNASCPGETSTSFIYGTDALQGFTCGASPVAVVYGPHGPTQVPMPLHTSYQGAQSQLEFAVNYLRNNPAPKLITISIGGNDLAPLLTCVADCEALAQSILGTLQANLINIYSTIRSTGYRGPIIATNYYAFDFKNPQMIAVFSALNGLIKAVTTSPLVDGEVADVYKAFEAASGRSGDPCKAGLLHKIPKTNTCDTHPSLLGHTLIAATIAYQALIN